MAENDDDLTKMLNDPKGRKMLQEAGPDIFSLPRSLEARRPLISALGTDPETGELFEYNPMFGGKAKQKRCHKRIKVKDSKNQDHRKNKVISFHNSYQLTCIRKDRPSPDQAYFCTGN